MEKARAAVSSFIGKGGHHETDVTESVAPAVVNEQIKPTRHEELTEAVDREVHQDHYHTTVQPIQHQEVLPERHTHNMGAVQERTFEHDDAEQTRMKLEGEAARFRDTSTTHETRHTTATAPTVEGEHVHHHVHEKVIPIIHKETIQPEVVHTTVPIHEIHKAESEHHGTSTLPMKTLDDFKAGGGVLTGGQQRSHEAYEGDPRPYNSAMQLEQTEADKHFHAHDGLHDHQRALGRTGGGTTTSGPHSSNLENKVDPRVDSDRDGRSGLGQTGGGTTTSGPHSSNLENRVDPRVDSDRDGRSGLGQTGTGTGFGSGTTQQRGI